MISKNDILKMARSVSNRSKGIPDRKTIHPQREWFIGILLFLCVALVGGVFNARDYVHYNNIEESIKDTTTPITKYRANDASQALEVFTTRQKTFNELSNSAPSILMTHASTTASSTAGNNPEDTTPVVNESSAVPVASTTDSL